MKISVEISMYPLNPAYGTPILEFIGRLKQTSGLEIITNKMSTQIFGEYDKVMSLLTKEIKTSFENKETIVMVTKFVNEAL